MIMMISFVCKMKINDLSKYYGRNDELFKIFLNISIYFFQFFASGLGQNGDDDEGFDGFLMEDILKELKRTQRLVGSQISLVFSY